ncbi:MAG: OsmC family peroxiredoxin [Promethearchaeota archaeon]|nr:MAG: OsmC family peroxiredoxin [Candidatus Lokiarchaeota archaeon]
MTEANVLNVTLRSTEYMIYKCDMGSINLNQCYVDEAHDKEEEMVGPNPSRLLGVAVMGCLSASFTFCMKKRDFIIDDLKAEAEVHVARNEKGFWRVQKIDVTITPKIDGEDARKRADQCLKMFERYCIVTQAVREGIEVNVDVNY